MKVRFNYHTDYNCHGWWSENGITYLLTTRSSSQQSVRPQRHCFAFRDLSASSQQSSSLTGEDSNGQEDSSGYNNNHNNRGGGGDGEGSLLVFSSFADSCRRNVVLGQEGDFAFNVTKMGTLPTFNSTLLTLLPSWTKRCCTIYAAVFKSQRPIRHPKMRD